MAELKEPQGEASLSFEDALARLEEIVHALEDGTVALDRSLSLFEEGVFLVKHCGKQLDEAERKITVLTKKGDGTLHEEPFDGNL